MSLEDLVQLYRANQFASAVQRYRIILQGACNENSDTMIQLHYYGAMSAFRLGDTFHAHQWITSALQVSEHASWAWVGRVRFQAGEIYRVQDDLDRAQGVLEAFLEDLDQYPEYRQYEAAAHFNLGLIHRQNLRSNLSVSIRHYETAVSLTDKHTQPEWFVRFAQNLAWALCEAGKYADAKQQLSSAEETAHQLPLNSELHCSQMLANAYLLYHLQQYTDALKLCTGANSAGFTMTHTHRALFSWLAAECYIAMGDWDNAEAEAKMAKEHGAGVYDLAVAGRYITALHQKLRSIRSTSANP